MCRQVAEGEGEGAAGHDEDEERDHRRGERAELAGELRQQHQRPLRGRPQPHCQDLRRRAGGHRRRRVCRWRGGWAISETKFVKVANETYLQGKPAAMTNGFGSSDEELEEKEPAVADDRPPSRDRRRMRQISTSLIRWNLLKACFSVRNFHQFHPQPPDRGRQPPGLPRAPSRGGVESLRGQLQPVLDGVPLGRPSGRPLHLLREDGQRQVVLPKRQRLQGIYQSCIFYYSISITLRSCTFLLSTSHSGGLQYTLFVL